MINQVPQGSSYKVDIQYDYEINHVATIIVQAVVSMFESAWRGMYFSN